MSFHLPPKYPASDLQPVFYFRQLPIISEIKIVQMLEVLCQRLDDEVVEVREMAASWVDVLFLSIYLD